MASKKKRKNVELSLAILDPLGGSSMSQHGFLQDLVRNLMGTDKPPKSKGSRPPSLPAGSRRPAASRRRR